MSKYFLIQNYSITVTDFHCDKSS